MYENAHVHAYVHIYIHTHALIYLLTCRDVYACAKKNVRIPTSPSRRAWPLIVNNSQINGVTPATGAASKSLKPPSAELQVSSKLPFQIPSPEC